MEKRRTIEDQGKTREYPGKTRFDQRKPGKKERPAEEEGNLEKTRDNQGRRGKLRRTMENKGNPGKTRGNQGKTKEGKGKTRETRGKPRESIKDQGKLGKKSMETDLRNSTEYKIVKK